MFEQGWQTAVLKSYLNIPIGQGLQNGPENPPKQLDCVVVPGYPAPAVKIF